MNFEHEKEDRLLAAIEAGQLQLVKQLLSSGIEVNTILHSKVRRESATALATAAFEGHLPIIEYLIKRGAWVHQQDPLLKRNALHWACVCGHTRVAELLLNYNIGVNCQDRDNVTPIIHAVSCGDTRLVALLISYGANVNAFERLHASALHYASYDNRSDVVSMLIKAGCILNNPVIFGEGTPMANLFSHGDDRNCRLLVEAGYDLSQDKWIPDAAKELAVSGTEKLEKPTACITFLWKEYSNPSPLYRLCCTVVRQRWSGVRVLNQISKLPLPLKLIRDLALDSV